MNRQLKGMQRLLTEPYVHRTTIRDALNCHYDKAKEIFAIAKQQELKKSQLDVRPKAVQSELVIQIIGSSRNQLLRQFKEQITINEVISK